MEKYSWGSGHFLNAHTLEFHEIGEHATNIKTHPEQYGVTKKDVEGLDVRKDREKIVFQAMDNGWIRVRSDPRGNWISFQYRGNNDKKFLDAIYYFVKKHKISQDTNVRIGNLSKNTTKQLAVKELEASFQDDHEDDLGGDKKNFSKEKMDQDLADLHTKPWSQLTAAQRELKKKMGKGFGSDKKFGNLSAFQMQQMLRTSEGFRPLQERASIETIREEQETALRRALITKLLEE